MSRPTWARVHLLKGFLVLALLVLLLGAPSAPTTGCVPGGEVAQRFAYCHFNRAVNASLGLNATIWFQQPVNDSWWWAHNHSLTWAFTPNLPFWAFVEGDLPRISAAVASNVSIEGIGWGEPLSSGQYPGGLICNVGNGSYRFGGDHWNCLYAAPYPYPFPDTEGLLEGTSIRAYNYTFVATEVPILPPTHWTAEVWWNGTGILDMWAWTALAEQLAARLNATWYIDNCHFPKVDIVADCSDDNAPWPFDAVFFGLLVFLGMWHRRKRRCTKERRF